MKKTRGVFVLLLSLLALSLVAAGCVGAASDASRNQEAANTENAAANTNSAAMELNISNEDSSGTEEAEYVLLKVGYRAENAPYCFLNAKDDLVGLDADLVFLMSQYKDWEIKLIPIAWEDRYALLAAGDIDCIWSDVKQVGLGEKYALTDPYYENSQVVLVKKDSKINSKSALIDKTVSVQDKSLALSALKAHSGGQASLDSYLASMRVVDNVLDTLPLLDAGKIDAIACSSVTAYKLMNQYPDTYAIGFTLSTEQSVVTFRLKDEEKAKTVSDALSRFNRWGTVEELCQKYAAYGTSSKAWLL